jgi:hypothetical protein
MSLKSSRIHPRSPINLGPITTSGCSPMPAYMDAESCPREDSFLSMESLFGPPADSSSPASFPPQGLPVLDWGWSDVSILFGCGAPLYPLISDVQAYSASLPPSLHSTVLAIDTAVEIPYPEIPIVASDIHDEDFPPTCPSETDTMCQTTISSV